MEEFERIASEAALKNLQNEAKNAMMAMGPLADMLRSFYVELGTKGFKPDEALHLTAQMLASTIGVNNNAKNN